MGHLPPIEIFKSQPLSEKKKLVLDQLFEPCDSLTSLINESIFVKNKPFNTYQQFIELVRAELLTFLSFCEFVQSRTHKGINPVVNKIISAHPRLGVPKDHQLSEHSSHEQRNLAGTKEMRQKLQDLNDEYEQTFPGLKYVVFVNGRNRDEIMDDMRMRIKRNEIELERKEAFNAICDIALDRVSKLETKL
ncbi:hypothetical protein KGF56_004634 [Candida oxycetoniae]|uniref:Oxo-4-hydroxy-4-carboxy-5-ureidoimidazoline decarboxylase domain-containing protein n=1 Tax=Candida oxycetoniae TaxID=497107 RepID=A0AAI9WW02_9ASCO|nr:uncharacterized protein KGF56_004634 [Candida oxycetoniae]KAI3402542.1 hypothetical protein KGF56_004634 [Candida oxycetoniae]